MIGPSRAELAEGGVDEAPQLRGLPAVGIEEEVHGSGRRLEVGQDLDELPGLETVAHHALGDEDDTEAVESGGQEGLGVVDLQVIADAGLVRAITYLTQ